MAKRKKKRKKSRKKTKLPLLILAIGVILVIFAAINIAGATLDIIAIGLQMDYLLQDLFIYVISAIQIAGALYLLKLKRMGWKLTTAVLIVHILFDVNTISNVSALAEFYTNVSVVQLLIFGIINLAVDMGLVGCLYFKRKLFKN